MIPGDKIDVVWSGDSREGFDHPIEINRQTIIKVAAHKNNVRMQALYLGGKMLSKPVTSHLAQMQIAHPDSGFPFPLLGQMRELKTDSCYATNARINESVKACRQSKP